MIKDVNSTIITVNTDISAYEETDQPVRSKLPLTSIKQNLDNTCALCYFHSRITIEFQRIYFAFPFSFSSHLNISFHSGSLSSLRFSPMPTPHHYVPEENRKRITLSFDDRFLLNTLCE